VSVATPQAPTPWYERTGLHVALVALVSLGFEAQFVPYSINLMDEGWPLYAAMGLHEGGSLYREVFWVFPPGHLLPAWIAYAIDPPGILASRWIYAGFTVALVVACYFLGRRVMPARYAVLACLLLALCGTSAHRLHLIFGFRYLVLAVLALLVFARRVDTGDRRYSFAAGVLTGIALAFRLTPAFAVGVGIAAGMLAADRSWRSWLRDGLLYAAGLLLVVAPLVAWFAASVGLDTLWLESVVRPVAMTDEQSLPLPRLLWLPATLERRRVMRWFLAWQYRLYLLLYAGYLLAVLAVWLRAWRARRPHPQPLLVALVVFGAVYFARTLGRSDAAHLYSAIPPVCLLLGHALWKLLSRFSPRPAVERAWLAASLVAWIYLMGSETFLLDAEKRGLHPLASTGGRVRVNEAEFAKTIDDTVSAVRARTGPDDRILVMGQMPLFYVLAGRSGVGHADVILPGTFLDRQEESAFIQRLEQDPPAIIVWSGESFDNDPMRHAKNASPMLAAWIRRNYELTGVGEEFKLLVHGERLQEAARRAAREWREGRARRPRDAGGSRDASAPDPATEPDHSR